MKKALIVGVDNYSSCPLNGCVADALGLASVLKTNGDGSPNFDIIQESNIQSKSELMSKIETLFSGDAEVALFYFSGHGSEKDSGYLVTPDFTDYDLGVPMTYLLGKVNESKCKNKIIILDCCYSGRMGESAVIQSDQSILGEGITIMTASTRDEAAVEFEGQGLFTSLLIQGLEGSASDVLGRITPASIYSFIDQTLGAWEQRPVFKTNTKQFLSLRDIDPKVSKTTLRRLKEYFETPSSEYQLDSSFEFTNDPNIKHNINEPYANEYNVAKFKELQQFASIGLVEPVDEEHMYFAAMRNKKCKLTALGSHYWKLSKDERF
ncbi:caspase family protein [Lactococcus lactis]|uniref:caspase family protein n=1 Tax=Lactococcus lactis TaxID=1358 RepID=UPI002FE4F9AC